MSEKALRKLIEPLAERHVVTGDVRKFRGRLKTALADDPDVVAALRILAEAAREHEKLMDDEAQDWNAGYEYGFYDAAVSLAFEIEKALHIRLTADGYEWTEEATE